MTLQWLASTVPSLNEWMELGINTLTYEVIKFYPLQKTLELIFVATVEILRFDVSLMDYEPIKSIYIIVRVDVAAQVYDLFRQRLQYSIWLPDFSLWNS